MGDLCTKRVAINQGSLRTTARVTNESYSEEVSTEDRIELKLPNGWMAVFQKRHNLRVVRSHGKSRDADESALLIVLSSIMAELAMFSQEDLYSANEFGIYFRRALDCTVAELMLAEWKKNKRHLTVLACASSSGTDRLTLKIIGIARHWRGFKNKTGWVLSLDCRHNTKA